MTRKRWQDSKLVVLNDSVTRTYVAVAVMGPQAATEAPSRFLF